MASFDRSASGAVVGPALPRVGTGWHVSDWRRPVPVAMAVAGVLHLIWWAFLANGGGDLAAQDAWTEFVAAHPDSAVNFSWYGGMHVMSYSVLSPYVMDWLGVRPTLIIAGTLSAGLLARLLEVRSPVRRPMLPAVYGAVGFVGDAISGRTTFALGLFFGLATLGVVFAWPERWNLDWAHGRYQRILRGVLAGLLAVTATASSPVAGLFLGLVAAALWLRGRHAAAYAVGVPPVLLVITSAEYFPFSGRQPMGFGSVILPVVAGLSALLLTPRAWRLVRVAGAVYIVAVVLAWLVPSPIGTNVTRLGLLFGGVAVLAAATSGGARTSVLARRIGTFATAFLLALSLGTMTVWQVATATKDAVNQRSPASWGQTLDPLVQRLQASDAHLGRVEVVPTRSHREASALAPYVNLARGWNRQADLSQNALFYKKRLTAKGYERWLHRWAVRYVVLPVTAQPDPTASATEFALVDRGVPYLHEVWSNSDWRLFRVDDPTPLVTAPAQVIRFDAAQLTLEVTRPARIVVRIPDSPWLSLVDINGSPLPGPTQELLNRSCLSDLVKDSPSASSPVPHKEDWLVLHATRAGIYRIAAPYKLPRGTACLPADLTPGS